MPVVRKFAALRGWHWVRCLGHLATSGIVLAMTIVAGVACAETTWPVVDLPKDAIAYRVGDQLLVAGLPMRLQGFVSAAGPSKNAIWFRQRLGKPLMENIIGKKLVLGRPAGEYFISIQLEAFGQGTRGLVSVSHLKAGYDNRILSGSKRTNLLARLPSGSRLISDMESNDREKLGHHLVISNSYHEDVNRSRLTAMMRDDGLTLEQDAPISADAARRLPISAASGRAMFFQGAGKQAIAVIFRDDVGQTIVILNTITAIEHFK